MKLKSILFVICCFFINIGFVNASSINYNLNIDKNYNFSEKIVYKVKSSEMDNSGNYDYLTSVVKDKVYFDNDSSVLYKKSKSYSNGEYTVTLKNNYSYIFLSSSRILKECFSDYDFDISDNDSLSIDTTSPFYCTHRANSIIINITTPLKVANHNANKVNGSTYTWNNVNDDFRLLFKVMTNDEEANSSGLDSITTGSNGTEESSNNNKDVSTNDVTTNDDNNDTSKTETKKSISPLTIVFLIAIFVVFALAIVLFFKSKSSRINKI